MSSNLEGGGWITRALSKVPKELHIPGYNFCGPNTRLEERLARGDRGINPLDEACREHDIFYAREKNVKERHKADRILAEKAWKRAKSSDAKLGERLAAVIVTGAMKAKVKVGGGVRQHANSKTRTKNRDFQNRLKKVKMALRRSGTKDIKTASLIARKAAKKEMRGDALKRKIPRIIPIPKQGGVIPFLVPLFAGLSAAGALAGGASAIAKTVNEAKSARKSLNEMRRHNEKMEAIAIGNKNGAGFFLRPYKKGYGLVVKSKN
jgi:Phospholipase A2-like domain